ncbi:MAG: CBS domain-containing protein [Myxococcota bacterium]
MRVRTLMRSPVVTIGPDDELALAAQLMAWNGLRHLPVLRSDALVGLVSERDVLAGGGRPPAALVGRVSDVMTAEPETIGPDADVEDAAARLVVNKHGSLPVVEGDALVGILTTTDLLGHLAQVQLAPPAAGGLLDRDVESIMTSHVAAVFEDDPLSEAAARMHQYGVRHLPVVDGMRRVIGVISDRDLLSTVGDLRHSLEQSTSKISEMRVRDAMTAEPRTVRPDRPLAELVAVLAEERFGTLPVVDGEERLLGMVSYVDVLRSLRQVS